MARFLRYGDSYINLHYVVKVEMKRGDMNYINIMAVGDSEHALLQIEEKDINRAESIFCSLRSVLDAENLIK